MDPCPFVRIVIRNLALKFPVPSKPASSFFCKIKLSNFQSQVASVPLVSPEDCNIVPSSSAACFNFNKSQFDRLVLSSGKKPCALKIEIYAGRRGSGCRGLNTGGKLLGAVSVPLNVKGADLVKGCVIQNGWILLNESAKCSSAQLNLNVSAEPDPRFVFQFDGEPECSPQVFQVNGSVRQPVFTCKFSFRNSGERNLNMRSRSSLSGDRKSKLPIRWLSLSKSDREQQAKERKGWCITIHDLSGSPVAAASMVTPFVPSHGSDRVGRSNPGAWLILQPGQGSWKPWGRLEAWREPGATNQLGYRFELLPDCAAVGVDAVTLANSALSMKNGGKFAIDISTSNSPVNSPNSSFDLGSGYVSGSDIGSGSVAEMMYEGFVMSSTVEGSGRCSKPEVEVGMQHVSCTEDAAAFVALAAAMDLSMDACKLFSQKLRKELRQEGQDSVV